MNWIAIAWVFGFYVCLLSLYALAFGARKPDYVYSWPRRIKFHVTECLNDNRISLLCGAIVLGVAPYSLINGNWASLGFSLVFGPLLVASSWSAIGALTPQPSRDRGHPWRAVRIASSALLMMVLMLMMAASSAHASTCESSPDSLWAFMSDSPLLSFFLVLLVGGWIALAYKRTLSAINIGKHGWPPAHIDADGEAIEVKVTGAKQ